MEREAPVRRSRRAPAAMLTLAALAACSSEPARSDNITVISVPEAAVPSPGARATASPAPLPVPTATPTDRPPLSQMKPHKDFTDPPLPPELRDDAGLKPLPPNPRK